MKSVQISQHDFEKRNLVTTSKGDFYECRVCKASGYRQGFFDTVLLTDKMAAIAGKCTFKKILVVEIGEITSVPKTTRVSPRRPRLVLLPRLPVGLHGVEEGLHEVVKCPAEYIDRYADSVWVKSKGGEVVRVLPNEIIDQEY